MKKRIFYSIYFFLVVFSFMNILAYFHASKFTHFDTSVIEKTKDAKKLSFSQKIKTVLFGINNPRPINTIFPNYKYETIQLQSNKKIECWLLKTDRAKGTVILFHGYSGKKSSMLDKANIFHNLGYNTLLVDFMGSGGSEGNQTTIGFYEAEEVKTAFDYIKNKGEKNIILFGSSMGAVAIMKAQQMYQLTSNAIILECPFGTMLETVQARFKTMHVPSFPMANLLVFWGGFQNNFNAFQHNPKEYAKGINCPTLLFYGQKDEKVSQAETDHLFKNLNCKKTLVQFPLAGHENYLNNYQVSWTENIKLFLNMN